MIGINVNKNNNQLKNSFFNFLFKFIAHINSIESETKKLKKFFFPYWNGLENRQNLCRTPPRT